MIRLILLAALVGVAGCAPAGPEWIIRLSKGQSAAGFDADAAQCRNQARMVAGVNQYAWFKDAYNDCMLGRGYERYMGQTQ